jgi:single-strand DNA-binding protein
MYLNQVQIIGRLTREPEVRTLETGSICATFSMATNEYYTDKAGVKQEKVEFHNIVLWGRTAEIAGEFLTKGQECFIQGKLQTRKYTNKDGVEMRTTEIVGSILQLGGKSLGKRDDDPAYQADQNQGRATKEEEAKMLEEEDEDLRIEDVPF